MTSDNERIASGHPANATVLLARAYELAARSHANQRRKGPDDIPYVNHVCAVALLAAEAFGKDDPEAIAAAVLHDVVEDSDITEDEITAQFGARVSSIVAELTDAPGLAELTMPERKTKQAEKMARATPEARVIKIADQTSNLRDRTNCVILWSRERNLDYLAGARRVVDACRGVAPSLEAAFDEVAKDYGAAIAKEWPE